jgi:hypothetical protein
MYETLEKYLQDISHYLAVKQGADEILAEIKSHILEKAEREGGAVTEETLQKTIAAYGKPQEVAAKYVEGHEIISPTFKKHLFRYTWMLFAVHFILTVVAVYSQASIIAIPFFFIPKMSAFWGVIYLPMALIYDFGLVALILYLVTQRKRDVRLPWFGIPIVPRGASGLKRPKAAVLAMLIALFVLFLGVVLKYHTLFFYSVNLSKPESLLNPAASIFFSIMFLAAFACSIIAYWVRFIFNSAWVPLVESVVILLILWVVWNSPIKPEFRYIPGFDARYAGGVLVLALIALTALRFLRSVIRVTREMSLV